MTNISTKYFNTLSPLFDAALCTSKRLYSAVQNMTSIIEVYYDSCIQAFYMLSSSPMTMSMTFKTSHQIRFPMKRNHCGKHIHYFALKKLHDIKEPRKHRLSRILGKKWFTSCYVSLVNFVQVYHHCSSWWLFWSMRWGGNYNSLASFS